MSRMRIRWETAGKVIAAVAAGLVIIGLAPSLLTSKGPEPLPDDVGLTMPPPVPAPAKRAPDAKARAAAGRRAAERRARLEAKREAARRRKQRKRDRARREAVADEERFTSDNKVPSTIIPTYQPPAPPPSAADEFGFER